MKNSVVHSPTKGSVLWSEELKKLKQYSIDVHNLWKMCGKPRMGTINDEKLRVKGLYKACINTHKRVLETRKREWLTYKLSLNMFLRLLLVILGQQDGVIKN